MKKNIITIITIVVLLLAIPSIWPYGYYQLLRWIILSIGAYLGYLSIKKENFTWAIIMGAIVIAFNPFFPFYLDKEIWVIIDLIASVLFLISIWKIKK